MNISQFISIFVLGASGMTEDCNLKRCEQCEGNKVIGLESLNGLEEDSDGDGNRTICARDRDYVDRSFPSICHMHCYNNCTRFGIKTIKESNENMKIVFIFRANYHKLHDGECEK